MALRLRIGSSENGSTDEAAARVLTSGRLTIGRSVGNDWTLVDPSRIISKFHCVVEGSGDSFRITDNSSNGVFINGADRPLGRGNSCALNHGDQVKIGPYCIVVEIEPAVGERDEPLHGAAAGGGEEPLADAALLFDNDRSIAAFAPQYRAPIPAPAEAANRDWPFSLDASPDRSVLPEGLADFDGAIGIDDAFAPPAARLVASGSPVEPAHLPPRPAQGEAIPTNWNVSLPEAAVGKRDPAAASAPEASDLPVAERASPPAAAVADGGLLAAFLDGAGVGGMGRRIDDPVETMHHVGQVFRIVVEGVIATLEARRTVKRELGVAATEFRAAENNPLKFTLGVDDTIATLLCGDERGFLPAAQAFEDAFADITRHQLAVLAGMQAAWSDLLRRFDPEAIKDRVGNDAGVGALLMSKKTRYWDAFVQLHAAVASDADNEYRSLFYRVFGEAYEKFLRARGSTPR